MKKSKIFSFILLYILLSIIIYNISNFYIKSEEEKLLKQKYNSQTELLKKEASALIKSKKNATLAIAITTARDKRITNALLNKNNTLLNLQKVSLELRKETNFKNVWFQILDREGKSFYRSWTKTNNDSLTFRHDVKEMLKEKKVITSISVGRYDMTFKSMIPIFHKEKFIGISEIITHFNSISREMEKNKTDSIVLTNKEYSSRIKYPFTKMFIDDYYIANLNAKDYLIKLLKFYSIDKIKDIKNYEIINNYLITIQNITDNNKHLGFIILSKDLSDINVEDITSFKKTSILYVIMAIFLVGFILTVIIYTSYSKNIRTLNSKLEENIKKIKYQEKKNQTILDSQKNIIVITDGEKLQNANEQLIKFFDEFKSLEEFKEVHDCVCERFIDMNDNSYVIDIDYNGRNWAEHILENSHEKFKAAMKKDNLVYHFALNVSLNQFEEDDKPFIIVTLTDISHEIKQNQKLKHLNENLEILVESKTKELKYLNENLEIKIEEEIQKSKEKDRILFQHSKMSMMSEVLQNIAHQWRQPLNLISTAASGIKVEKELNILNDKNLNNSIEAILNSSTHLSQTIENFQSFFNKGNEKEEFSIKESLKECVDILDERLSYHNINLKLHINKETQIYAVKSDFQQAILNIINNSIDAFENNRLSNNKLIIIECNDNSLLIKDNALGLNNEVLEKAFEPYFTTKHQSQGAGLGLYMAKEILTKNMSFSIELENIQFKYENENFTGAQFTIIF